MPVLSIRVFEKYFSRFAFMFKPMFSRFSAFNNFRIALLTSMVSIERKGVTDTARMLPSCFDSYDRTRCYETMIKFFKNSEAFDHRNLWTILSIIIRDSGYLYRDDVEGRVLLVIDGHNAVKSGRRMPCVSRITQSSETPTKPQRTFGHLVGSLGVVAGSENKKQSCFLIAGEIQNGEDEIRRWNGDYEMADKSHVEKMLRMACTATDTFADVFLLADSYFFSDPALNAIKEHNLVKTRQSIVLVSKAKKNCVAWTLPPETEEKHRGRPRVRGDKVYLRELFDDEEKFTEVKMNLYGKEETVKYREEILLWGQNYTPVKFVLTISSKGTAIFICTDTNVNAVKIISLYSKRWKIESSFKVSSQDTKVFSYHFWSKKLNKLDRFAPSSSPDPLASIPQKDRKSIANTFRAYERFITISFIAQSLLQLIALILEEQGYESPMWLRTRRGTVISVGNLIHDLHYLILLGFGELSGLSKLDKNKKDDSQIPDKSHRPLKIS